MVFSHDNEKFSVGQRRADMRLSSVSIQGVGRFDSEKINVAGKIVAIVGPNEAGKTSLLSAMNHLTSSGRLPIGLKSRAVVRADRRTVVSATYEIDNEVPAEIAAGLTERPTRLQIARTDDDAMVRTVIPRPAWSLEPIASPLGFLRRAVASKAAASLRAVIEPEGDEAPSADYLASIALRDLEALLASFEESPKFGSDRMRGLAASSSSLFMRPDWQKHEPRMQSVVDWVQRPDPHEQLAKILWASTPEFAFFGDADRDLKATYDFDPALVASIPEALANLLGLAGLDLSALYTAHSTSDTAARAKLLRKANKQLEERFHATWHQATLAVQLDIQDDRLVVLILEADDEVTVFDERSAGLRSFVALIAFVESGTFSVEPILLIDEAEQHLHFDAQAELVEMLEEQKYASKIIYTTHSPGCLPTDLGARVRVVEPVAKDSPKSRIRNQFWTKGGPGFSPLMMAMGAGAAAFTPARRAVIAEGASEMILMPRLLREAIEAESLPYQVAPGLSEAPKRIYPDLDLEAARVAFLVDGDAEGRMFRKNLVAAGFADNIVFTSPAKNLEMLVDSGAYLRAANEAITWCNPGNVRVITSLPPEARADGVAKWCERNGLVSPSKIVIATHLADAPGSILSAAFKTELVALDFGIRRVLRVAA